MRTCAHAPPHAAPPNRPRRLWDVRSGKCTATTATGSGLYVTWCPDGSSYAVMNSENALSFIDTRKAGKIVKTHKFPMEVRAREGGWLLLLLCK